MQGNYKSPTHKQNTIFGLYQKQDKEQKPLIGQAAHKKYRHTTIYLTLEKRVVEEEEEKKVRPSDR